MKFCRMREWFIQHNYVCLTYLKMHFVEEATFTLHCRVSVLSPPITISTPIVLRGVARPRVHIRRACARLVQRRRRCNGAIEYVIDRFHCCLCRLVCIVSYIYTDFITTSCTSGQALFLGLGLHASFVVAYAQHPATFSCRIINTCSVNVGLPCAVKKSPTGARMLLNCTLMQRTARRERYIKVQFTSCGRSYCDSASDACRLAVRNHL